MGVHGVGVDYHQPQLPGGNHHHWILQQIGQLDGNSVSGPQVKAVVERGRQRICLAVHLGEGQGLPQAGKCRAVGRIRNCLLPQMQQGLSWWLRLLA